VKRRSVIALLILAAILIVAGFIAFFHAPEPSYQGKTVAAWIDDYVALNAANHTFQASDPGERAAVTEAFKEMGTNCIPFIFRRLERQDAPMRTRYRALWPKLPKILQRLLPAPKPVLDANAASMLVGYSGGAPVELCLLAVKSPSSTVREVAVRGIHDSINPRLAPRQSDLIIPEMTALLNDPSKFVRLWSAGTLGMIGPKASNAVPVLIVALHDNDVGPTPGSKVYVRAWTATALGRIGPPAGSAVPDLTMLLSDPDVNLRWKAAYAIWQINSNAEITLPVMVQALPKSQEKWNLAEALGQMGSSAKDAVPALEKELAGADTRNREVISNALMKIDPEATAKLGSK
jgi:HEAT repeat protein